MRGVYYITRWYLNLASSPLEALNYVNVHPHTPTPTQEGRMDRPVIVHRAVLGSVERMFAILTEHFAAKWPFWLNPKQVSHINVYLGLYCLRSLLLHLCTAQVMIVPITDKAYEYAQQVWRGVHAAMAVIGLVHTYLFPHPGPRHRPQGWDLLRHRPLQQQDAEEGQSGMA